MKARDIAGIALIVLGAALAPVGWRWLGASWFWGGVLVLAAGLGLVLHGVRERHLLEDLRKGGGVGDYGERNYLGGTTSATDASSADGGGDG